MSETNPYSDSRDDIAEMWGTKNDPKDYGNRTPPTIPVVEVTPVVQEDIEIKTTGDEVAPIYPAQPIVEVTDGTEPEQSELHGTSELPLQFIISKETREVGLANIAKIREQLARKKDV